MRSLSQRLPLFWITGAAAWSLLGDPVRVALQPVAEGLTSPLSVVPLPDRGALVVDQIGMLRVLGGNGQLHPEPALNLTNRLSAINHGSFDERGLIDVALHPDFAGNRRIFVTYTAPRRAEAPADWDCTLRLSEFRLPAGEPLRVDPASEKVLLEVDKPYANHNSGRLAFGPDGLLYLGVGDGGNAHDQGKRPETGNGQNLRSLLGKILRLDVDHPSSGRAYGIPSDNPFADGREALPEIYAYGLRNPWGLSFDRGGSRELFVADVGQDLFEEVDIIRKGGNYGWSLREGLEGFSAQSPKTPPTNAPTVGARGEPLLDPILQYRHTGLKKDPEAQGISITGGHVYRGKALPALEGRYVFGDWSRNWGVPQGVLLAATRPSGADTRWSLERLEVVEPKGFAGYVTGFGQDRDGELYVLTNGSNGLTPGKGRLWKLVPAAP
ncbi:MAG: PQQ-dependent sugar dehydrogenase [Verrucomicrobia bacterium]|nr:PQQ-dependent sugar dehydrogenase [Verrucomicrobiota bacterium]